jgi:Fe2+ transport system protein FeoA
MNEDAHSEPLPLTQLRPGEQGTICGSGLSDPDRRLLSAMGLRDHARVVLCRLGEPCIVRVMGGCGCASRIGLSMPLASRVLVRSRCAPGEGR